VTHRLHLRDDAELDVIDAVAWYEGQRPGLGTELLLELDAVMERIIEMPFQFPDIKGGVRRALLHRFPYSVYFKVADETVDVVAILHHHRRPSVWEQRIVQ
jgi:plasmid stabilization system protein ParE